MGKIKNVFIGLFQVVNQKYYEIVRQDFNITEEWFDKIFQKHYTSDIKEKYNSDLFVDQGTGVKILRNIGEANRNYDYHQNELRVLGDWIKDFLRYYEELKTLLKKENILINEDSRQYIQLELLKVRSTGFLNQINQHNKIFKIKELDKIDTLHMFDNTDLEIARSFNINQIDDYLPEDKFISQKLSEQEDGFSIVIVFRRLSEIVSQIRNVNDFLGSINSRTKFIHSKAGMGKSNLSAFLTNTLISNGSPVIFIKARSFNGDPDNFDEILMRQLEVPNNYLLSEVLGKLNNFGKVNQQRVTLIFDGLNETSCGINGFSPIWKNNLDQFIEQLKSYPYLFFVTTLRTSYIERIWESNSIPYNSEELIGFNDKDILLEVVEKYFNHYNIKFNSPSKVDVFYFQTPLLLDLYCKMLNPDRIEEVDPKFGLEGFSSVFEQYISKLAQKIKFDLRLVSTEVVTNGIQRCSFEMLRKTGAFLPILTYYSSIEGGNVSKVDGTVAHGILEEFLIYLKESLNDADVVVHTQQEVGGYLLAKALLNQYNNDISKLIQGEFFQKHIIGSDEDQHQLANDIMKFLIVVSGEYKLLIENFASEPTVKDYLWIKLQREETSELNIELRKTLSAQLKSKEDIARLLDNAKPRLFHPDSPLNFLFVKDEILKLSGLDFELTWSKFLYKNANLFSGFLKVDFKEFEEMGQLEISLEITIWLLESTSHNMRDEATKNLLEYSITTPSFIFTKVEEYSVLVRPYIYERLSAISYGVCLRKQNDTGFINGLFKEQIMAFYNLQFGKEPTAPVYNYIVIDSLKHIVDLAIYKEVFALEENDLNSFKKYNFRPNATWSEITDKDKNYVAGIVGSWHNSANSDPFKGDFVHYTIPRLQKKGTERSYNRSTATANIYKRLIGLGYKTEDEIESFDTQEHEFYFGHQADGIAGKIDRLGKKYSWMAFFDYAGHLLNIGELEVFQEEDTSTYSYYKRLSDVELEVSFPVKTVLDKKLYTNSLFADKSNLPLWTEIEKFDTLEEVYKQEFNSKEFTLVDGYFVESEKSDHTYNVRSFLLVESFLVKKSDIEGKEEQILNRTMDWDHAFHASAGSLSKTYFGELYWADNIPILKQNSVFIPSTEMRKKGPRNVSEGWSFREGFIEKERAEQGPKMIPIQVQLNLEPTIVEYHWESDSEIYPSLRANIPSTNIGKQLNLKTDPEKFLILDENLEIAFESVEYEEKDVLSQNSDYLRTDLLKKYLKENDLVLMYQIKQHTFDRNAGDGSGDFRGMQFKIIEL